MTQLDASLRSPNSVKDNWNSRTNRILKRKLARSGQENALLFRRDDASCIALIVGTKHRRASSFCPLSNHVSSRGDYITPSRSSFCVQYNRSTRVLVECNAMKKETNGERRRSSTMQSAELSHNSPETFWSSELFSYICIYTCIPMKNNERETDCSKDEGRTRNTWCLYSIAFSPE